MKYFGTDGIRGVVDETLDFSLAYNVGKSIAIKIKEKKLTPKVIIGKDTRLSGDLLSYAVACGLMDYGADALMLGTVPTACVSYLCSKQNVGFGVMITASHNSADMNGIKVLNRLGYKLSTAEEVEIEEHMLSTYYTKATHKGVVQFVPTLVEKYEKHIIKNAPNVKGFKVALDCANGAAYEIAPKIFRALGAEAIEIACENNGANINNNCGALHSSGLKSEVIKHKCDVGFAFDGDADRLLVVLKNGKELMGDELIYLFACHMLVADQLNSLTVVGTLMTNSGCEESLNNLGINLERVDVGDRNVITRMRENNYSLGGESSGHICIEHLNTTCDALMNAMQFLKAVDTNFDNIHTLLLPFKLHPSILKNVSVSHEFRAGYNEDAEFSEKLNTLAANYADVKILVRPSGTESVIRIFAEGKQVVQNEKAVCAIEKFIKNYSKKCCEKNR